ncbi:MAG: rhodanese-related sulfurtransferase [Pseudomonadota bacterium]
MPAPFRIAALYKFTPIDDPGATRSALLDRLAPLSLCGTLLIAPEGINGTIAGTADAIAQAIDALRSLPGCSGLDVKYSDANSAPFRRFKIRLKREIVTMGEPDADPNRVVGTYVAATDWNTLLQDPGTVVIDTRNDYEVGIGTFEGAINPHTISFGEFPDWFRRTFDGAAPRKVAMFCTGGIRCEKATSFVKQLGIDDVFHLEGGILRYLETVPKPESLWRGECFVFDERVSVGHGLKPGEAVLCRACKYPVTLAERTHPDYEQGVACRRCATTTTDEQKARFRERQHQIARAEARGIPHLGQHAPDL